MDSLAIIRLRGVISRLGDEEIKRFGDGGLSLVKASFELFAISYRVIPELRQVVVAWEQRAMLAAAGVIAAYILLRLRSSRRELNQVGSTWGAALRLTVGGLVSASLWVAVDLLRGENFLGELWAALPPQHVNAVKGLLLVGCGWAGWSLAISEFIRRLVTTRQKRPAHSPYAFIK